MTIKVRGSTGCEPGCRVNIDYSPGSVQAPHGDTTTAAETHPFTAPILHNTTRSPLAGLAEDVIIHILHHADDVDLLCLRRTCRTMRRLISRPKFGHLQNSVKRNYLNEKVPEMSRSRLRILLRKDMYCEECRTVDGEAERRLREESLYCCGCRRSHPVGLFSYKQRRETDKNRICIGREGHIRACQHLTISWADIDAFWASKSRRGQPLKLFCDHPSRMSPFSSHPYNGRVTIMIGEGLDPGDRRWFGRFRYRYRLMVRWNTHVMIPRLGQSNSVDISDISDRIAWLRGNAGSHIFQDQLGKFPSELRIFDPNTCDCIKLPSPPPGISWNWSFPGQTYTWNCPKHSGKKLDPPTCISWGMKMQDNDNY
ncbi:hypothetical protein QBC37DRAFT_382993 [Rhypophila decipiens]|uniref:F-box domain-containing protein n=1 Tax=Rhypophila decipiens TaxID=261697 RepID=A0AAN6YGN4_9PEZI|nr:hypothetical protein QBC37DRAFT_382993 [Rhypophila decipiens]